MFLATILLLCAQTPTVEFLTHPVDGQLYPRDAQSLADVRISGQVHQAGWQRIFVIANRDGIPFSVQAQQLHYHGGKAAFDLGLKIRAERHAYSFRVMLMNGAHTQQVGAADNVVAGDVFLIQGQSNAVAWDALGEGLANREQSPWVRSFGTATATSWISARDKNWYQADGQTALDKGSVGAWGLRMGRLLVDSTNIPVAILNGAVGATAIRYHLPKEGDHGDTHKMYGRLLTRARNAGVANSVRAMIWHQGESDGSDARNYAKKFSQLHNAWLEDYPSLEMVYMFQVREGCGQPSVELREVQRSLKDHLPLLQVMSTTAVPGHDGCHYHYAGYQEFASRITRLIARDLYGSGVTQDIDAPDLDSVSFTTPLHQELRLVFRDADDTLHLDLGALQDFELTDGVTVTNATVSANTILLTLSGPTTSRTLAYNGHSGHRIGGGWITNARGIGALTFKVLIQP
jgi:hypothetical protein